ncbi:unnamed protein product [Allacma fusca]|uniref:Ionotropic glutamate receptor C-terminal domain-containing protein n=1 Tax=Allacma fusca TaxID=39272 RepID=A0A8J2K1L8_9HEXA|nr:unnamed protein product [Allacma fusca]
MNYQNVLLVFWLAVDFPSFTWEISSVLRAEVLMFADQHDISVFSENGLYEEQQAMGYNGIGNVVSFRKAGLNLNLSDISQENLIFNRAGKEIVLFLPRSHEESDTYLKMILTWAYQVRYLELRASKTIFFYAPPNETVSHLSKDLRAMSAVFAANCCQYLYPTTMDNFYVTSGSSFPEGHYQIYHHVFILGRRRFGVVKIHPVSTRSGYILHDGDLNGTFITGAIVESKPQELVYNWDSKTNVTTLISGLTYDVILFLQDSLNFRINVTNYFSGWVEVLPNNTVQNIGRILYDEEEDIFMLKSTYIPRRAGLFTLLIPHHIQKIYAFFRQPNTGTGNLFWHLFTPRVWATLFITVVILGLSKATVEKIIRIYIRKENSEDCAKDFSNDHFIWVVALITQQGWSQPPRTSSMKVLFLSASVLGLICYVAFSANLVSALSFSPVLIKTFFELLQSSIRIAADTDSSVIRNTINGNNGEIIFDDENALLLRSKTEKFITPSQGGELILSEAFAFIGYEDFKSYLLNTYNRTGEDFCKKIAAFPIYNLPFRSGLISTKNFPYRELFNTK